VKEVKGKKLPEADDEFAKVASEFDTLEELKSELRDQLRQNRERSADADVRDRVLQAMMTLDQLLEAQGFDELRFRADARDHAIRAIKADLVLEAIARQEGIEVTAEEIGREIGSLAAALGREPKDLAKSLDRTGQVVALAGDIIRSK